MRKLASWCFRHKWLTLIAWVVALVALNGLHGAAGSAYSDNFKLPHTESFDAVRLLQKATPHTSGETDQLVYAVTTGKVTDPAVKTRAEQVFAKVAKVPHVAAVVSPYTPQTRKQISPDGRVAFANVTFDNASNHNKITAPQAQHFVKTVQSGTGGGVQFQVEGNIAQAGNPTNQGSSLVFGFIAAAIVLFIAFGSFVAMLLPLVGAGVSLGCGIAVVGLLSHVIGIATFSNQLALLIGLGVGVDYALFIVTRYRQAVLRGASREDAVVEAIDTSGRAVLFAGLIVVIAMLGMFVLGVSFLYGVAVAAAVTVAFTVISALTLLPAMLSLSGRAVLRRKERRAVREGAVTLNDESPLWTRWTGISSWRTRKSSTDLFPATETNPKLTPDALFDSQIGAGIDPKAWYDDSPRRPQTSGPGREDGYRPGGSQIPARSPSPEIERVPFHYAEDGIRVCSWHSDSGSCSPCSTGRPCRVHPGAAMSRLQAVLSGGCRRDPRADRRESSPRRDG